MFHQYDPRRVIGSFRGIPFLGVKDGTFIEAERLEEAFAMDVGSVGDVCRVQNLNRTGRVTVTLMQSSPSNDLLSQVAQLDELSQTGFGPILVRDLNGNAVVEAPISWIVKIPKLERADQAMGVQWVFDCHEFVTFIGGNLTIF